MLNRIHTSLTLFYLKIQIFIGSWMKSWVYHTSQNWGMSQKQITRWIFGSKHYIYKQYRLSFLKKCARKRKGSLRLYIVNWNKTEGTENCWKLKRQLTRLSKRIIMRSIASFKSYKQSSMRICLKLKEKFINYKTNWVKYELNQLK
jgi:hypothetical protein